MDTHLIIYLISVAKVVTGRTKEKQQDIVINKLKY